MSSLNINIYSIKGKLFSGEADTVVLPGYSGDIGVISGERILTYLLKAGIIYFIKGEKTFKRYFIFNGRFVAHNNDLIITTEYEVIDLDNINTQQIEKRIALIQNKVDNATNEVDKTYYEYQLQQENILLSTYKNKFY